MRINLIGLGKMGYNLALNLKDHRHHVMGFDLNEQARLNLQDQGVKTCKDLASLSKRNGEEILVFMLLVPYQIVDTVIEQLTPFLKKDDIIIDAGNSNYLNSIRRFQLLKSKGYHFVDMGTSGGTQGARSGVSLMVGGEEEIVKSLEPMFKDIAVENGFAYTGRPGSGHFTKMIHNGIEYGMLQAIAEGFDLMEASPFEFDYEKILTMWNHGSIIESRLLKHLSDALKEDPKLSLIEGIIDDSGEGTWMIEEALKYKVSMPVITQSLFARYKSKDENRFAEKIVASIRKEFGGHAVHPKK